jgi:hypothetical protein
VVVIGSADETSVSELYHVLKLVGPLEGDLPGSWWKGVKRIFRYTRVSCIRTSYPAKSRYDEKSTQLSKDPGGLTCCTGWTRSSVDAPSFFVWEDC